MRLEETKRDISTLVSQVSAGEIKLPEIQRGYVWKPTQIAKLVDSLYRGYPMGSLLFWRSDEIPGTRAVASEGTVTNPVTLPLYLLDGQQRLTSLHRVFNDHSEAQIVFNVADEVFQNQSASTKNDPRWIKVHNLLGGDTSQFALTTRLHQAMPDLDPDLIAERLKNLGRIKERMLHMEVLADFDYDEVAQIFVRVNSGGRSLGTTDLALATLSARRPGTLHQLEEEAQYWAERDYGDLDVQFLARALTAAVLGRGLSKWSNSRLVEATDAELDTGWQTVKNGLRHLVPLLKENLGITNSRLLPSHVVLLPLTVLLGERPDEPMDAETANGVLYWFLAATLRNRYSNSTDSTLGVDIPAVRRPDPIRGMLDSLDLTEHPLTVSPQALIGKTTRSPYFLLSFLITKDNGAHDWWTGTAISTNAEGQQKLEYHHVFPQARLRKAQHSYTKTQINELANLVFISGHANRKISARPPSEYFTELPAGELEAHYIPTDTELRTEDRYLDFLAERRALLAEAMTIFLDRFRPKWLVNEPGITVAEDSATVEFTQYRRRHSGDRMLVAVRVDDTEWSGSFDVSEAEQAVHDSANGLGSDLIVNGETVPIINAEGVLTIAIGPVEITGTLDQWYATFDRERSQAVPVEELPDTPLSPPWETDRVTVLITDVE